MLLIYGYLKPKTEKQKQHTRPALHTDNCKDKV